MIKKLKLLDNVQVGFFLFSIACHEKSYKLCWRINKKLNINMKKTEPFSLDKNLMFTRYCHDTQNEHFVLVSNRSKGGYIVPREKTVNYFFRVEKPFFYKEKEKFIKKLRTIPEILLIFEVDLEIDQEKKELFYD